VLNTSELFANGLRKQKKTEYEPGGGGRTGFKVALTTPPERSSSMSNYVYVTTIFSPNVPLWRRRFKRTKMLFASHTGVCLCVTPCAFHLTLTECRRVEAAVHQATELLALQTNQTDLCTARQIAFCSATEVCLTASCACSEAGTPGRRIRPDPAGSDPGYPYPTLTIQL
jgi:hypothetical protein